MSPLKLWGGAVVMALLVMVLWSLFGAPVVREYQADFSFLRMARMQAIQQAQQAQKAEQPKP